MFSYFNNYILFFFNYELFVFICFFFFLLFAILSEKGQLSNYLQQLSVEARLKFTKYTDERVLHLEQLITNLNQSSINMRTIGSTYTSVTKQMLLMLQYVIKKLVITYTTLQIRYYLDAITERSKLLTWQIRSYLTQHLFISKSYNLQTSDVKLKKLRIIL